MDKLNLGDGNYLAYDHLPGSTPGILFCGGFASDMTGTKATYLGQLCARQQWQYTRFDYRGHGRSTGVFSGCGIDDWLTDAITMLDTVCNGPQIVVGSSMGAWIATLLAEHRPSSVAGLVCVAAAPDFTEKLLWNSFDEKTKTSLESGETFLLPNQYDTGVPHEITINLINSGRQHQVLNKALNWNGPTRLLHGDSDTDVPVEFSIQLFNQLQGSNTQLTIVKQADHRFSATNQLLLIANSVGELVNLSTT